MYIGLPKSGSTTFHSLMTHLGLPSFHVGGPGLMAGLTKAHPSLAEAYSADEASCARYGRTVNGPLPMHHILQMIGPSAICCMLSSSGYRAFSDDPWPLLYRHIDQMMPHTKFVLWAREPQEWARSFTSFFRPFDDTKWLRLAYGTCNMSTEVEPLLASTMHMHVSGVRNHFEASPSRRTRLLLIEDMGAAGLPQKLCEFVMSNATHHGATHPRCAALATMPHVLPKTEGLAFERRSNLPLGPPMELPTWRQCVAELEQQTSPHGRRTERRIATPISAIGIAEPTTLAEAMAEAMAGTAMARTAMAASSLS